MASIQARHSRSCSTGKPWTPFASEALDACDCRPTFYVVVREGKSLHRERVGKDRRQAERALRKIGSQVDEGAWRPHPTMAIDAWAKQWVDSLERKPSTVKSYRTTVKYIGEVFGSKPVRKITPADVAAFNAHLREMGAKPATRLRHLRALGTCLNSAVRHGYAAENPVKRLPEGEKPRKVRRESAFFTDEELPGLFAKAPEGLYGVLFETALKTGMRLGELSALIWGCVDLTEAVIRVRSSYTDGNLGEPKNHEKRDVDVTPDVVDLLGAWWGECGKPDDDRLVFAGPTKSGYLSGHAVLAELYTAMGAGEVPRVGPTGEKRTFHSFRHTYARIALEHGAELTWLSRHLGHSSTAVTDTVYGHWARAARKQQVKRLEGAFSV